MISYDEALEALRESLANDAAWGLLSRNLVAVPRDAVTVIVNHSGRATLDDTVVVYFRDPDPDVLHAPPQDFSFPESFLSVPECAALPCCSVAIFPGARYKVSLDPDYVTCPGATP